MADETASDFCPYVGLQPFTVRERAFFFGREREQRIIAANLFAAPLTILYGPSAVGKSSVLQAGVVPRLAAEPHTAVLYFATWQGETYLAKLKNDCRAAIQSAHGKPIDVDDTLPLDEWIASARLQFHGTLLMMFDQFEEYLLYHGEEDEKSFDGELARIINRPDVRANILIGLRDDSLSKLNRFSKRIPNLMGNTLPLRRLTPEAARQAIVGPIEQFNRQFPSERPARIDEALVVRVLDEVRTEKVAPSLSGGVAGVHAGEERGLVETAYLQLVLTELWRAASARSGPRVLDSGTLDALGGAKAIVRRHVSVELGRLTKDGREIAVRLFQHLVTPSGAKYALRTEDLVALAGVPRERVVPVLTALTAARLLRRIDPPERYEIFHDAFAVAMLDWRQEYLQHRRQRTLVLSAIAIALLVSVVGGTALYVIHERRDAAELRVEAQIAGDIAKSATEAAKKAQQAADAIAREADLRVQAGQLQLEADRARLQGETARPRAVQLQQQAQQTLARADTAKSQYTKLSAESKAAAVATEKSVADLTQLTRTPAFGINAAPNTVAITKAEPPPVAAAPTEPAPAPAPPPTAVPAETKPIAGNYKDTYKKAIEAKNQKRRPQAQELFETALKQNGSESTERINISGFGNVEPYVPKYYLGVVFKNLNNCPAAIKEFDDSERDNAIQKTNLYKSLLENRDACAKKQ